jgi:hypothetical protein
MFAPPPLIRASGFLIPQGRPQGPLARPGTRRSRASPLMLSPSGVMRPSRRISPGCTGGSRRTLAVSPSSLGGEAFRTFVLTVAAPFSTPLGPLALPTQSRGEAHPCGSSAASPSACPFPKSSPGLRRQGMDQRTTVAAIAPEPDRRERCRLPATSTNWIRQGRSPTTARPRNSGGPARDLRARTDQRGGTARLPSRS